jgi:putative transposase
MKRKRFSEEQIIGILKESEAGAKTKDLSRKHGIFDATFYNWKAKYAGMTVSQARRLRELELEHDNTKLKKRALAPDDGARTPRHRELEDRVQHGASA